MKYIYSSLFCSLLFISLSAQTIVWKKILNYADYSSKVSAIESDSNGNLYSAGWGLQTVDCSNSWPGCNPHRDITFLQKTDPSGNLIWSDTINTGNVNSLAFDGKSNLYIASPYLLSRRNLNGSTIWSKAFSHYANPAYFMHETKVKYYKEALYSYGSYYYISKYDTSGNLIWAKKAAKQFVNDISFSNNYIYIQTGSGDNHDPDSIHKYDLDGNMLWSISVPGYSKSITSDEEGNCYVSGDYYNASFGEHILPTPENGWAYIAKLNSNGLWEWAKKAHRAGGSLIVKDKETGNIFSVETDNSSNGYLASYDVQGNYLNEIIIGNRNVIEFISLYHQSLYFGGRLAGQGINSPLIGRVDNNLPTGIKETTNKTGFEVYPNPATDEINLQLENGFKPGNMAIYNVLGKTVKQISVSNFKNGKISINASDLPKGVYFIDLVTQDTRITKKLVLQ